MRDGATQSWCRWWFIPTAAWKIRAEFFWLVVQPTNPELVTSFALPDACVTISFLGEWGKACKRSMAFSKQHGHRPAWPLAWDMLEHSKYSTSPKSWRFLSTCCVLSTRHSMNSSIGIRTVCRRACPCTWVLYVIWDASLVQKRLQSNSQRLSFHVFFLILLGSRTRQPIGLEPTKRQQHRLISQPQTTRHTLKKLLLKYWASNTKPSAIIGTVNELNEHSKTNIGGNSSKLVETH